MICLTLVCDSTSDRDIAYMVGWGPDTDAPLNGTGCRPAPLYVERVFEGMGFTTHRAWDKDLNSADSGAHVYDWVQKALPDGKIEINETHRRFWYFRRGV